jgi:hypothetical protein
MLLSGTSLQPFLKRFVTPADTAKVWSELPLLKQEGRSVETDAAKCNNMNSRITEGSAIGSTTLFSEALLARKVDLKEALNPPLNGGMMKSYSTPRGILQNTGHPPSRRGLRSSSRPLSTLDDVRRSASAKICSAGVDALHAVCRLRLWVCRGIYVTS